MLILFSYIWMLKLIVWLGNPWSTYDKTRHNAGFLAVDHLISDLWGTDFLLSKKFNAEVSSGIINKRQVIYVKPQTYMNKSWWPVYAISSYYWVHIDDVLVIHDDIDRDSMTTKLKYGGSHGWHNWVRDIIGKFWSKDFWRLKLWVWRPSHPSYPIVDYVLWRMNEAELTFWSSTLVRKELVEKVEQWLKNTG